MVLNTNGTRQSPTMSDRITRKMIADVIAASRGKRMARPLQDKVSYDTASLEEKRRLA